jgi:hypothetical protein
MIGNLLAPELRRHGARLPSAISVGEITSAARFPKNSQ